MQRNHFLALLATLPAAAVNETAPFQAARRETNSAGLIPAPPEAVFPLLCPVREYDWIDGWQCRMIYSRSGVAEDNCLFETAFDNQRMVWTCTRYEPPTRIEYNVIAPEGMAFRLDIRLSRENDSTRIHWRRVFTGLNEAGNRLTQSWQVARDEQLTAEIAHYLATGAKRPRSH